MTGETRLVRMMEVLSPKTGEVVRYTHPYDVSAEAWWEAGITRDEVLRLAKLADNWLDEHRDERDDPTVAKVRAVFGADA